MDNREDKPVFSVRIDRDLIQRVDKLCERVGVSRADVVERCLLVGLDNEEEFVKWLESRISGPVLHALTHPKLAGKLLKVLGYEIDPNGLKIRDGVAKRRRTGK